MKHPPALSRVLSLTLLLAGALVIMLPFIWLILVSLKPANEIFSPEISFLPTRIEWTNYVRAFVEVDLDRFLLNGLIVVSGILFFQILFAVPCAYALSQRRFPGRQLVFGMILGALLVPFHVAAIPIFLGL
ncbi:MAG: carbohydrate ABC transporter permease, partial [Proteobacteria bacterium]